jgi:hypothetical protein
VVTIGCVVAWFPEPELVLGAVAIGVALVPARFV